MSFIVLFDDQAGLAFPMGWDDACEGAICGLNSEVALFATRADARKAISISAKFAALQKEQGKIHNTDFTEDRAKLEIRKCVSKPKPENQ